MNTIKRFVGWLLRKEENVELTDDQLEELEFTKLALNDKKSGWRFRYSEDNNVRWDYQGNMDVWDARDETWIRVFVLKEN